MFKYPDNIIVNWLRSKMQGKIDSLQSQVDELEKNYFNVNDNVITSASLSIDIIDNYSFSLSADNTTATCRFPIGEYKDFIGKKIAFFCHYADNTNFSNPRFCVSNTSFSTFTTIGGNSSKVTTDEYIFLITEITDESYLDYDIGVTFSASTTSVLTNEITYSNVIVKVLD